MTHEDLQASSKSAGYSDEPRVQHKLSLQAEHTRHAEGYETGHASREPDKLLDVHL